MRIARLLGLAGLWALAGCNQPGPALTAVSGTVTQDGQPLAGALVKFLPQGDAPGYGGSGRTGPDGQYTITAQRLNRKGLPPGDYKVIVTRLLLPDGSPLSPDAKPIETAAAESVPEPFCKPHLTPLNLTVGAEAVTFDIPLKK